MRFRKPILDFPQNANYSGSPCLYFIYFIDCGGHIKIGSTFDLKSRLTSIQTSNPSPISHNHGQVEKALHEIFHDAHIRGEWYNLTEQDIDRIKAVSIDVILQIAHKMEEIRKRKTSDQLPFKFLDE